MFGAYSQTYFDMLSILKNWILLGKQQTFLTFIFEKTQPTEIRFITCIETSKRPCKNILLHLSICNKKPLRLLGFSIVFEWIVFSRSANSTTAKRKTLSFWKAFQRAKAICFQRKHYKIHRDDVNPEIKTIKNDVLNHWRQ